MIESSSDVSLQKWGVVVVQNLFVGFCSRKRYCRFLGFGASKVAGSVVTTVRTVLFVFAIIFFAFVC